MQTSCQSNGALGLAQNFAALKALATEGIQASHEASSSKLAMAAGVRPARWTSLLKG
ncbi:MAG TPA: hypothetical protein EYP68_01715 [Candidatus Korarchaeota archaeon]|nr:hypothetical protein [Candidatus Korarchaeota archaeon]